LSLFIYFENPQLHIQTYKEHRKKERRCFQWNDKLCNKYNTFDALFLR